jgi:hypothetical protein
MPRRIIGIPRSPPELRTTGAGNLPFQILTDIAQDKFLLDRKRAIACIVE